MESRESRDIEAMLKHEPFGAVIEYQHARRSDASGLPYSTLAALFRARVAATPDLLCWRALNTAGHWEKQSWGEVSAVADLIAKGLVQAGAQPLDRVAVVSTSSPAWLAAAMASATLGTVLVPVYDDLDADGVFWQISHSDAKFVFVADTAQLSKVLRKRAALPAVQLIVQLNGDVVGRAAEDETIMGLAAFMRTGQHVITDCLLARWADKVAPEQVAVLAYTAGTMSGMKAAMLSHDALSWTATQLASALSLSPEDVVLSYLSWGSVSNLVLDLYAAAAVGATIAFGTGDQAGSQVLLLLQEVAPTVLLSVPRVWEDLHRACIAAAAEPHPDQCEPLGLGRCRWAGSTGALLSAATASYFAAVGVPIFELYGSAETCGVVTVGTAANSNVASVGTPLPGLELDIHEPNKESEGVLLVRGRNVCSGYFKDELSGRDRISDDGYFNTGDMFRQAEDGCVFIFGHKKEMLRVASNESFVAPAPIETLLKQALPLVGDVVVLGNGLSYLSALLTLKSDIEGAAAASDEVSAHAVEYLHAAGITETSIAALAALPAVKTLIDQAIAAYNATVEPVCAVKKWALAPRGFSVANHALTPTLKPRRRVVARQHAALIDGLYAGERDYAGADQVVGIAAPPSPSKSAKGSTPKKTDASGGASAAIAGVDSPLRTAGGYGYAPSYGSYGSYGPAYAGYGLGGGYGYGSLNQSVQFGAPAQFFYPSFGWQQYAYPQAYPQMYPQAYPQAYAPMFGQPYEQPYADPSAYFTPAFGFGTQPRASRVRRNSDSESD